MRTRNVILAFHFFILALPVSIAAQGPDLQAFGLQRVIAIAPFRGALIEPAPMLFAPEAWGSGASERLLTDSIVKPPLDGRRLVTEVAVGYGVGLVGLTAGSLLALAYSSGVILSGGSVDNFDAVLQGFGFAGAIVGSAVGVYWVGTTPRETGSFWATLAGSALGFGPLGATLGFNMTRRYRDVPPQSAFINVSSESVSLGPPVFLIRQAMPGADVVVEVVLVQIPLGMR